jgi:prepilin-type N-terminal cleavage/methylation domain-containing protein
MMNKRGFTLIELLVVIAIIALLLSVLVPALKRAKESARDVICRSNLKQWGVVWGIYTSDNKGKFPTTPGDYNSGNKRGDWIVPMRSVWDTYGDIVRCPSASKYVDFGDKWPHGSYHSTYFISDTTVAAGETPEECSYGMNVWAYSGTPGLGDQANYWQTITVRGYSAGSIPLFMDSMWRGGIPAYTGGDAITMQNFESEHNNFTEYGVAGGIRQFAMPRHGAAASAGTNVLFFDFSTSHVNIKELWLLKWHRTFNTAGYEAVTGARFPSWMDKYN